MLRHRLQYQMVLKKTSDNKENAVTLNTVNAEKLSEKLTSPAKRSLNMSPENGSVSKLARTCSRKRDLNESPMESGDRLTHQVIDENDVQNDKIISPDTTLTKVSTVAEGEQQSSSGNDTTSNASVSKARSCVLL